MSRVEFERELAEYIEAALKQAEENIAEKYPGAFKGFPVVDSPVGVTASYHEKKRIEYRDALAAGVRWSIWIKGTRNK